MTGTSPTGNGSATSSGSEPIRVPSVKRAFDVTIAAVLLVVLAPAWTVALGAMGLGMLRYPRDRGRLIYRERRISRGRPFDLLKLRTLRESVLAEATGFVRPYEADVANLTWAGRRVLKPLYLDELPQILNVLRGEMSLVGPRPWTPALVERQVARGVDYRQRLPAGWTGPVQVAKRRGVVGEDLDRGYLELLELGSARSIVGYDLHILRRTVAIMLRGQGLSD